MISEGNSKNFSKCLNNGKVKLKQVGIGFRKESDNYVVGEIVNKTLTRLSLSRQSNLYYYVFILSFASILSFSSSVVSGIDDSVLNVAKSNSLFSDELYSVIKSAKRGNFLISPLVLGGSLAVLKLGANGTTSEEIRKALKIASSNTTTDAATVTGYSEIIRSFQDNTTGNFQTASQLYISKDYKFMNKDFVHTLQDTFQGSPKAVNFAKNLETASEINNWVYNRTNNQVKLLISGGSLYGFTKGVLVNAIYFRGEWKDEFRPEVTRKSYFFTMDRGAVFAEMMERVGVYRHAFLPQLDATALAIPYKGDRLSLIIVLPNEGMKLSHVESKLRNFSLASIPERMSNLLVKLRLPKFRLESDIELVGSLALEKLGMPSMLNSKTSNFNKISSKPGLYINLVVHKSVLEVSEEAIEQPSFTQGVTRSLRYTTPFLAERPFIVTVYDEVLKTCLFVGRKVR